jgi:hypothetical protein
MSCSVSTVLVQTPRGKKRNTQKMSPKNWILILLDWIFRLRFMVFNATFNNIFSYIVAVSFIGGRHRSTRRKPQTCRKSLRNFITYCCIKYTSSWTGFKLTTLVVIGTDAQVVVNPTTIRSRPLQPLFSWVCSYGSWIYMSTYAVIAYHHSRGCHGPDHVVVEFATTCVISAYHLYSCEFESH